LIFFSKNEEYGIDVADFGELLMSSGIVLNDEVKWISFHSGYDFGYLLKVLTCKPLPAEESEFFESVRTYFPCIYDIKFLMKSCKSLKGGLNDLADDLKVDRIGPQHQAGSDSLLTCHTFFKMRSSFFENSIDDSKYLGILYGLSDQNLSASTNVANGIPNGSTAGPGNGNDDNSNVSITNSGNNTSNGVVVTSQQQPSVSQVVQT